MRMTLCREAGGMGDAIRVASVGRSLELQGHDVTIITLSDYVCAYTHIMRSPTIVTVGKHERRERDEPLDPAKFPYLKNHTGDHMLDMYCPAFREESEMGDRCSRSRLDIFAAIAGVKPEVHAWNVSALENAEASGYIRSINPTGKPMVALQPHTNDVRMNWLASGWQYVIDELSNAGFMPLVFHNQYRCIRSFTNCRKLAGLPIPLVAAIFAKCASALMPDSSLFHLSCFLGIPSIGIFGATSGEVVSKNYQAICLEPTPEARNIAGCTGICWGNPDKDKCIPIRFAVEGSACPATQTIDKDLVARLACRLARAGSLRENEELRYVIEPSGNVRIHRNRR